MEEMSKKTKRLEKENLNLTRKQEATNKNIFQMAEERSQSQQAIDRLTRENEKLKKLCRAMQTQGYGSAAHPPAQPGVHDVHGGADEFDEGLEGETESEYEDEEYDEDDDGEYDDDTEEEGIDVQPRTYGPPPPPPPQINGMSAKDLQQHPPQVNGNVNGGRH
jgi:hypothetical protein